jgi:hypothetical protein
VQIPAIIAVVSLPIKRPAFIGILKRTFPGIRRALFDTGMSEAFVDATAASRTRDYQNPES